MALYCNLLRTTSFVLNLLCTFIVPIVESIAYKFRFGYDFDPPPFSALSERQAKRKKRKGNEKVSNGGVTTSTSEIYSPRGKDGKRVKLLVDITVRPASSGSGNEEEVRKTTRYVIEEERGFMRRIYDRLGLILTLINLPSSIALYATSKVRQWAYDLESLEISSCGGSGDDSRVKKSPKRRIPRANYRKIIPFFPFNLLGFSNYTAFQMPILTRSTGNGPEETNNLNASSVSVTGNGKARSKRRRHSSTGSTSSSDNDFSHLELSEVAGPSQNADGHDEVDSNSDETPETATKPITSSSSSSNNGVVASTPITNGKITFADGLLVVPPPDGAESGNTSCSDMDSRKGQVGDEVHVMSAFYKELEKAANESYNSAVDPEYKPPDTTSDSSFLSGSGGSGASDSFLQSGSPSASFNNANKVNGKGEVKLANVNGSPEKKVAESPSKQKLTLEETASAVPTEDDYKTPEEGEDKQGGRTQF